MSEMENAIAKVMKYNKGQPNFAQVISFQPIHFL